MKAHCKQAAARTRTRCRAEDDSAAKLQCRRPVALSNDECSTHYWRSRKTSWHLESHRETRWILLSDLQYILTDKLDITPDPTAPHAACHPSRSILCNHVKHHAGPWTLLVTTLSSSSRFMDAHSESKFAENLLDRLWASTRTARQILLR